MTGPLDQLIAELEHDLDLIDIRLRLARELRATFTDAPSPAPVIEPVREAPPAKPAKRTAKKRASGTFTVPQGLPAKAVG